ncbi:MAG TPA: beta-ketoacyl-[acyl-carrier-protein] synthase family protein, partial [Gemmatimonadaceae bacterium]|nr:beta-ketoacyl-[acyl-carrier-protein] synthase family protein [Gemmatimonadaceae bacterium]
RDGFWAGLQQQRSAVRSLTRFDPSEFRSHNAAEINDFVPTDHLDKKRAKRFDRFAQFSVVGAQMALVDAELDLSREDRERVGANMGTALGGVSYAENQLGVYLQQGLRAVDASLALTVFGGAASCNIAIELGAMGPNSTNSMSCASGTIAIGDAFRQIRDGYADVMIAGGAEAPLAPLTFGAFALIRAMSTHNDEPEIASRPFDKDRDGFVMGEGAAVLILEEYERAKSRGAKIYAEVAGYGTTNDAHHMTAPRPDGSQAARSMRLALQDADVSASEIEYVNTHGSSTPLNDTTETMAIKQVLGDRAYRVPMSGTKGYYGHALGASGAIETAICALALEREWLPPTVNLQVADKACDLNFLPGTGRKERVEHMLTNSFGFGGINAALVLRRVI